MAVIKGGWLLTKIISGGQEGADLAGLVAGKTLNYETGGCCPLGCRTEKGENPELVSVYGLRPTNARRYQPRTILNITISDGTVIFGDVTEGGSALTLEYCVKLGKPYLINPTIEVFRDWIMRHQLKTLNVAGNRESKNPGIYDRTLAFLLEGLIPF